MGGHQFMAHEDAYATFALMHARLKPDEAHRHRIAIGVKADISFLVHQSEMGRKDFRNEKGQRLQVQRLGLE